MSELIIFTNTIEMISRISYILCHIHSLKLHYECVKEISFNLNLMWFQIKI